MMPIGANAALLDSIRKAMNHVRASGGDTPKYLTVSPDGYDYLKHELQCETLTAIYGMSIVIDPAIAGDAAYFTAEPLVPR